MATSEYGGDQLHLTENCRHFVKMNVIRARREYPRRYPKPYANSARPCTG